MGYEYIVVAIASALAGIGTGLVGLSAATAMVPLMIVLCPTFGGEHGAYMATAIALASDILGRLWRSASLHSGRRDHGVGTRRCSRRHRRKAKGQA